MPRPAASGSPNQRGSSTAILTAERLARIRAEAERKLSEMRAQIAELNDQLRIDASDFDLPEMSSRRPTLDGREPLEPLLDSWWPFAEQCRALIDSKAYRRETSP